MRNHSYREAMERLPFSDDLEARTLAMLKASSDPAAKEEEMMKTVQKEQQSPKTPMKKSFPTLRPLVLGGSLLAVAACLLLVVLPVMENQPAVKTEGMEHNVPVDILEDPVSKPAVSEQAAAPAGSGDMSSEITAPPVNRITEFSLFNGSYDAEADIVYHAYAPPDSMGGMPAEIQWNAEEYATFADNRFLSALTSPLSTFAADVDTASYAKLRASLLEGKAVPEDSVRIEEMLNYFSYEYAGPGAGEPFGVSTEIADCPWNPDSKLLLIGLQAEKIQEENIPRQNLVFLIDVSGSMDEPDKLPLVVRAFKLLLEELKPTDTVSIVTYASGDRVVLDGIPAREKTAIMEALDSLRAGGGTAGAQGIQTAYELAEKHFIDGGNNRIILATDGDLNIGVSDEGSLTRLVEEKRRTGVYLSVLGFGSGNYKDNKLEALADNGNGNYAYIDTIYEARKALVEEIGATFLTVAQDVKIQVEFNPARIKGYRLIGYENRTMAAEDFADDQKDGGEVGSGHQVTVLYEIVPVDSPMEIDGVETRYQTAVTVDSEEWLTVSLRCKKPGGDESQLFTYPVDDSALKAVMSDNLRFASAVAETGMLLRDSEHKGSASYQSVLERLRGTASVSGDVYREEFQYMVSLLARQAGNREP